MNRAETYKPVTDAERIEWARDALEKVCAEYAETGSALSRVAIMSRSKELTALRERIAESERIARHVEELKEGWR